MVAAKAMADYGRTRVQQRVSPSPVVSMEDAYIDQFGPTLYQLFFQRYSEKVWGLPCDQMSGDWVSQRSKGMSLVTAVKDAVVPSKGKVVSLIDEFMYPRDGFGRFSERMADAIGAAGNEIRLNTGVEKVHREGNRVVGVTVSTENGTERIEADNFISSIPLTLLAKIMDPAPPAEILAAADALTFRNIITVNLMLKKRQVTPDTWLYVHDRNILFGRFHEPKNWSPAMVPSDDFTSLVVEYFCSFGDHIWTMSEEELVAQTVRHLVEDLKFITPDEVIGGFIVRAPRAYPAYVIGYKSRLPRSGRLSASSTTCRSLAATARSATTTPTTRSRPVCWPRRTSLARATISIRSMPTRSTTRSSASRNRSPREDPDPHCLKTDGPNG